MFWVLLFVIGSVAAGRDNISVEFNEEYDVIDGTRTIDQEIAQDFDVYDMFWGIKTNSTGKVWSRWHRYEISSQNFGFFSDRKEQEKQNEIYRLYQSGIAPIEWGYIDSVEEQIRDNLMVRDTEIRTYSTPFLCYDRSCNSVNYIDLSLWMLPNTTGLFLTAKRIYQHISTRDNFKYTKGLKTRDWEYRGLPRIKTVNAEMFYEPYESALDLNVSSGDLCEDFKPGRDIDILPDQILPNDTSDYLFVVCQLLSANSLFQFDTVGEINNSRWRYNKFQAERLSETGINVHSIRKVGDTTYVSELRQVCKPEKENPENCVWIANTMDERSIEGFQILIRKQMLYILNVLNNTQEVRNQFQRTSILWEGTNEWGIWLVFLLNFGINGSIHDYMSLAYDKLWKEVYKEKWRNSYWLIFMCVWLVEAGINSIPLVMTVLGQKALMEREDVRIFETVMIDNPDVPTREKAGSATAGLVSVTIIKTLGRKNAYNLAVILCTTSICVDLLTVSLIKGYLKKRKIKNTIKDRDARETQLFQKIRSAYVEGRETI